MTNLSRHLGEKHGVKAKRAKEILAWIATQNVADTISRPADHSPLISGLMHEEGFACTSKRCQYRTASEQKIERHCSKEHGIQSRRQQVERHSYSKVILQFLFAKSPEYFIVEPTPPHPTQSATPTTGTRIVTTSSQVSQISDVPSISATLSLRVREAIDEQKARHRQIGEPNHVSEITPWLRKSRFHKHLAGVEGELIETSCSVPQSMREDARLRHIALSVDRVLRKAFDLVEDLHHLDAKTLNTFQVGTVTQDPFQRLQNPRTLANYINVFQSLACYFIRVSESHFERDMFLVADEQRHALEMAFATIEKITHLAQKLQKRQRPPRHNAPHEGEDSGEEHDPSTASEGENGNMASELEAELDQHTFQFSVALVQQRTQKIYDSGVASFCAAKSSIVNHSDKTISWRAEGDVSGIFSKLIYCCQLLVLQQAYNLAADGVFDEMGDALHHLCGLWILSNSRGPVGTLNDWRLYAMHVGASTVPPAIIVWDHDGQNLTYGDLRYGIPDLSQEMVFCLREAQEIFQTELCLGFTDIPTYPIRELQDNWSSGFPGYSFVEDTRNAAFLEGQDHWLGDQIAASAEYVETVFHTEQLEHRSRGTWPVRSEFAKQYQVSVENFLEHLLVLVHKGSGQPARRVEFLGTRWRNVGMAPRNLRLHSGHVLFILDYHKSQTRTHASRSPVRFLFPAVAQLLLQFLVLIQPFRTLLAKETQIPPLVGDYLWSTGEQPWPEERMTRILTSISRRSLGRAVNVRAWRQICVGIAVKRFSGMNYEVDADLPGNADDDDGGEAMVADGVTLPASFHAQAAHGAYTGNRAYGGSINFSSSLTDAGVQVYLWTSQLWWTLFERSVLESVSRKRARPLSMSNEAPSLPKRVAHRVRAPRHLRRWGSETVLVALRRLYSDPRAQFRSERQREMVAMVAAQHAEVVVILATGGGKSLAFMVPMFLPQAGTTVVVVPLVALKSDLVRRCWDAGVQYSVWDAHGHSDRYVGAPLLFVSAEQAVREPFRRFVGQLDANRQLDRVVFDECHLILTASEYRPKLALLRYLRAFRCQVVFLSATLPPVLMAAFQSRMLLDQPRVVREVTFRSDLYYDFHRQSQAGNFEDYMVKRITRIQQEQADDGEARMIVYVPTKEEARDLAARLQCEYYYSDSGAADEKEQVMARWRDGIHRAIVATSAFGTGVDYAHVRVVIHQGLPTDAINFAQEVGRLGRDGRGGTSWVILPHTWMPIDDVSWERGRYTTPLSERVMQRYVSQSRCLWATLSRYVDGADKMQYCGRQGHVCGVCRVRGTFPPEQGEDSTAYWDHLAQPDSGHAVNGGIEEEDVVEETSEEEGGAVVETLEGGSQRLWQSERVAEEGRARFLERCRRWQGSCFICQLLRGGQGLHHTLDECRTVQKWRFIQAKRSLVDGDGRAWVKDHVACWSCGQLPTICDGMRGPRGCEFRDMVLPGSWALFPMTNRWGRSLVEVSGQGGGFESEGAWMRWLGQECEVFGERGIQAVRMFAWVLEQGY